MSPLSQKLSELRPFSWVKSWQNLKSKKISNLKISLTFWDLDQFFFLVKSIYISESTHKVSRSKNNLEPLSWIQAFCAPPGSLPGPRTPGLLGLNLSTCKQHCLLYYSSNFVISSQEWYIFVKHSPNIACGRHIKYYQNSILDFCLVVSIGRNSL